MASERTLIISVVSIIHPCLRSRSIWGLWAMMHCEIKVDLNVFAILNIPIRQSILFDSRVLVLGQNLMMSFVKYLLYYCLAPAHSASL